jgi:hypothetical protein
VDLSYSIRIFAGFSSKKARLAPQGLSPHTELRSKIFFVAAGFSLRLHRRDAGATGLIATWYQSD